MVTDIEVVVVIHTYCTIEDYMRLYNSITVESRRRDAMQILVFTVIVSLDFTTRPNLRIQYLPKG